MRTDQQQESRQRIRQTDLNIRRLNHHGGERERESVHSGLRRSPVIDKVLSSRKINESGLTGRGRFWGGRGGGRGDARGGNPVPAKWLIPLIPEISNVKS